MGLLSLADERPQFALPALAGGVPLLVAIPALFLVPPAGLAVHRRRHA